MVRHAGPAVIASIALLLGACDGSSPADTPRTPAAGTQAAAEPSPTTSPAFAEWPEIPAPPVGRMMSSTSGGFRQEAYYRAEPAGEDVYRRLVDFYVRALSDIGEVQRPPEGQREGETTLRVETADGRVATVVVHTRGPDDTVDVRMELTQPY